MKKKPLKVLHLYPAWQLSGVCSWTEKVLENIETAEFEQRILITGQPDEKGNYQLPPLHLPHDNLMTARMVRKRDFLASLYNYITQNAPCILLPNFDFDAAAVSGLLPRNIAICAGIRSDDPVYYQYAKTFGKYWDSAVSVSKYLSHNFEIRFPNLRERLCYIANGVKLPNDSDIKNKVPHKVVYCNRIADEQKRAFDILAIAKELTKCGEKFEINVLGSGPDEERFRNKLALDGLESVVKFHGLRSRDETMRTLESATYFLMTSAYEGMPNSLLEAMAAGVVPLVYDIPSGVPEIVEDGVNGHLFAVGDVSAMAGKLAEHLRHPEMAVAMGERAREKISQCFSVKQMSEAYEALWRNLGEMALRSECLKRDGRARTLEPVSFWKRWKRRLDPRLILDGAV